MGWKAKSHPTQSQMETSQVAEVAGGIPEFGASIFQDSWPMDCKGVESRTTFLAQNF